MNDGIKYLGHSAFYIKNEKHGILIDPWFMHNEKVKFDIKNELINSLIPILSEKWYNKSSFAHIDSPYEE